VPHNRITKPFLIANLLTSLPLYSGHYSRQYLCRPSWSFLPSLLPALGAIKVRKLRFLVSKPSLTYVLCTLFHTCLNKLATGSPLYACQQQGTSATATNVRVPFRCRSEWAFICFRWQFGRLSLASFSSFARIHTCQM
jgi:hypothetical protein